MRKGWFGPKVLGWGVGPRSWEGWLATAVFALSTVAAAVLLVPRNPAFVAVVPLMTIAFFAVVALTYRSDRS